MALLSGELKNGMPSCWARVVLSVVRGHGSVLQGLLRCFLDEWSSWDNIASDLMQVC